MRKRRNFVEGAAYHITSRTNNKVRIFEQRIGQRIMLLVLAEAKKKFGFRLANFCVMPTHIHLLIIPGLGTNPAGIMHWIKMKSSKFWNSVHGSSGHIWGNRYFAGEIRTAENYRLVMDYIDNNPIKAGLSRYKGEYPASGAYYIRNNRGDFVDYDDFARIPYTAQFLLA
ncbi:MAG: transposase [Spirochaetales bacterium]|nr:transposase [Spirochaetales bacterium]